MHRSGRVLQALTFEPTGTAASHLQRGTDLQIMFGIGGEHDLTERELPHLSGWRASRPVRVGNGAWDRAGAVAQAFGSDDLDASNLMRAITQAEQHHPGPGGPN